MSDVIYRPTPLEFESALTTHVNDWRQINLLAPMAKKNLLFNPITTGSTYYLKTVTSLSNRTHKWHTLIKPFVRPQ